jgi:hypothetical protein
MLTHLTLFIPSSHTAASGRASSKCGRSTTARGGQSARAAPAATSTRAGARFYFLSRVCRLNLYLNSKKHSKVKATLDDETQRRKHFYGIDAGVKKMAGESKKPGADSKAKHGHKK